MSDNRREFPRLTQVESVSIQLVRPGEEHPVGRVVQAVTLDISREGMSVELDERLSADHFFDLCIKLQNHSRIFLLTGEIRWCRPKAKGGYEAGILIHEGVGTDIDQWFLALDEKDDGA